MLSACIVVVILKIVATQSLGDLQTPADHILQADLSTDRTPPKAADAGAVMPGVLLTSKLSRRRRRCSLQWNVLYIRTLSVIAARRLETGQSGARENIIAGPYHNLIPYVPRSRKKTWGWVPLTIPLVVRGAS